MKTKAFSEITTFSEMKLEIENSMEYLIHRSNSESLELALKGLTETSEETKRKTLQFMHHIDRKMSSVGSARGNRFHKIPTLISGYIYLRYFPEQVKDLSLDELMLLSRHSIPGDPSFYETAVDYIGKDTLTAVVDKHPNEHNRDKYLSLAIKRIDENSSTSPADFIKNTSIEELDKEAKEDLEKMLQEVGKYLL